MLRPFMMDDQGIQESRKTHSASGAVESLCLVLCEGQVSVRVMPVGKDNIDLPIDLAII